MYERHRRRHEIKRARNKRIRKRAHGGNSDVNNVKKKRLLRYIKIVSEIPLGFKLLPCEERDREKRSRVKVLTLIANNSCNS